MESYTQGGSYLVHVNWNPLFHIIYVHAMDTPKIQACFIVFYTTWKERVGVTPLNQGFVSAKLQNTQMSLKLSTAVLNPRHWRIP